MALSEERELLAKLMLSFGMTSTFTGTVITFFTDRLEVMTMAVWMKERETVTEEEIIQKMGEIKRYIRSERW